MSEIDFEGIDKIIKDSDWFHFGKQEYECPGLRKKVIEYYMNSNKLPSPCNECYKALVFWDGNYSKENVTNLFNMLSSLGVNYRGKLNDGVVVFYFRDKSKMLEFIGQLNGKMKEFNVKGRIQWRRACKEFQDLKPKLWRNAKEFIPNL